MLKYWQNAITGLNIAHLRMEVEVMIEYLGQVRIQQGVWEIDSSKMAYQRSELELT